MSQFVFSDTHLLMSGTVLLLVKSTLFTTALKVFPINVTKSKGTSYELDTQKELFMLMLDPFYRKEDNALSFRKVSSGSRDQLYPMY